MPIPSEFTPILQSLPPVSSEWDEENRTLVLTTGLRYPGTEESVMIFVTEDASIGGWQVDDGGSAALLLSDAGIAPNAPGITAYLKTAYEENVLMMDAGHNFGIPVSDADDLLESALEVASGSLMLYAVGRFGAASE